jgi:hypothetical protein
MFKEVLSSAASNIFSGQSLVGISLPVRIFEPRSLVERIADWFGYSPLYLQEASKIPNNPLERFKLVTSYAIASLNSSITTQKPFNPLLGETYQGFYENGTRIYIEHTSHHPPVSNYLI